MDSKFYQYLPGVSPEEINFIDNITKDYSSTQIEQFLMMYNSKRRDPQHILLFTLIGLFAVAGVQRFMTDKIGLGVLYLLTGGLCLIGTIMDAINYQKIALEYNIKMMHESTLFIQK